MPNGVENNNSPFQFKSKVQQAIEYLDNIQIENYEQFFEQCLNELNFKEFEILFEKLKFSKSLIFDEFQVYLDSILIKDTYSEDFLGFKSKLELSIFDEIKNAEKSLNTGDYIAFLFGKLKELESLEFVPRILFFNVLNYINVNLIEQKAFLKTKMSSQNFIPIEESLYVFFLYEKEKAFHVFKKIIAKDLDERRIDFFELEHFQTVNNFFQRIQADYIPIIRNENLNHENSQNHYITKKEIFNIIDKDDYFKVKDPLGDYENLLSPIKDFKDYELVKRIFSDLFKLFRKDNREDDYDIGSIFVENISNKYNCYNELELNFTKTEILKLLSKKENKVMFIMVIFLLKNFGYILHWQEVFPPLFNKYVGNIKGYSISSIENYFKNVNLENPACQETIKYLKNQGLKIVTY